MCQIKATWLGDFAMNKHLVNFNSKFLLVPDWRLSENISVAKNSPQIKVTGTSWD